MDKIGNIKVYYGWLHRTNSVKRVNKQIEKFNDIKERFMNYKNKYRKGIKMK